MALKFWLGGAESDKSSRLIEHILHEADEHPERQYLVIVPEQFGLATQRELVLGSKNHGILNIDVLSFTRFAHRISDEVGAIRPDVTMLDDVGKSLLIGMLANNHKKDLRVFGDKLDMPGCIDKLKSIISEFMQYGITPEKAREMSEAAGRAGRGVLSSKLGDVALLYKAFKDYIRDRYTTVEETLENVSALIPQSLTVANSEIMFDGFTGFTPVQNKLIGTLMEYAVSVHVALLLEDCIQEKQGKGSIQEHELFYLSKQTMSRLGKMADERHVVIEDPYKAQNININNTCNEKVENVYSNDKSNIELNNTPVRSGVAIRIFAGKDPDEEISMVFTRIMELIRNEGYRYKDIAIATGDIEGYRHPVEREFAKHGIPFFIDRTEPVLLNPFIEYIRSFLAIFSDNYSISSVFRFLKSGLTGFADEETDELENYCLAVNIKGNKAWHTRFDTHTGAAGPDELLVLNGIRERFIAKCDAFIEALAGRGVTAASEFTVKQFVLALYSTIGSDGIEDKLRETAKRFEEAGERKLAAQYDKIYVKIMNVLEELCDLIPDEKTDIRGFSALLDDGLDAIRIGVVPGGMDYVQVGDLTRSRINDVKALFIVGANDGVIPQVAPKSGIINENERQFLTESLEDLVLAPSSTQDIYTQQLYMYMALRKPSERLFVSYARHSSSGSALLPSYIVKKLMKTGEGVTLETKPDIPSYYTDEEEAFDALTSMLFPALSGALSEAGRARARELMAYFLGNDAYSQRLTRIFTKEILHTGASASDSIGAALAHAIYGKRINASITRLETYAKCAYSYFLKYGLSLKEREIFSFEARDIGNIFHDSMKEYSHIVERSGHGWNDADEDERHRMMDEAVDAVIAEYRDRKLSSAARTAYMENRIRRIMRRSADIVSEQLRKGKFTPKYFEVDFDTIKGDETLSLRLSDDDMMRIYGRIDRVDAYESEGAVYIRIIDYKSSYHDVDLVAVYEGRQLQLLVYLNAAKEIVASELAGRGEGGETKVIPAGVLYYHMDDPMIASNKELSESEISLGIMRALSLKGLVNKDPDVIALQDRDIATASTVLPVSLTTKGALRKSKSAVSDDDFAILSEYVTKCMKDMGKGILSGNIAIPQPDSKTRFTGPDCGFCPYSGVCAGKPRKAAETDEDAAQSDDNGAPGEIASGAADTKKDAASWIELMRGKDTDNKDTDDADSEDKDTDGKEDGADQKPATGN